MDRTFEFLYVPLTNDPNCNSCGVSLVDLFPSVSLDALLSLPVIEYGQVDVSLELELSIPDRLCVVVPEPKPEHTCADGSKPNELLGM